MSLDRHQHLTGVSPWLRSLWTITRFETILAYNAAYVLIGLSFSYAPSHGKGVLLELGLLVGAIGAMKAQSSIADAIHDANVDSENPTKSSIPTAVNVMGEERARSTMMTQLILSMFLYGWLTHQFGDPLYLVAGTLANWFGYTYSYPPRFKEKGILNHVVTTGVDVGCVLLPVIVLVTGGLSTTAFLALVVVFWYTFSYHVLHQAADTYHDRQCGVETFTTAIGVPRSLDVAIVAMLGAAALAGWGVHPIGGLVIGAYAARFLQLRLGVAELSPAEQTAFLSKHFDIGRCAVFLNLTMAATIYVRFVA